MQQPWLDYTGQRTAELLACKKSHRLDSLNCAFEWGIQAKQAQQKKLSPEERLVLAVRALDREVNNGGFDQFLTNSSKRYAGQIVEALRAIGATKTADLVAEALTFAKLPFKKRMAAFEPYEERFFRMTEIESKLFRFIEKNQAAIELPKARKRDIPEPIGNDEPDPACGLLIDLQFDKSKVAADMKTAIERAQEHARRGKLAATRVHIETAATWYMLIRLCDQGKYAAAEKLLAKAIRLGHEDFSVELKICVEDMADAEPARADRWTLAYLEDVYARVNPSKSDVAFWSQFVRENARALPNSEAFRRKAFARGKQLPLNA